LVIEVVFISSFLVFGGPNFRETKAYSFGGEGVGITSLGGKYDVIFSYIYTIITKLVLHLSYLVRLD